MLNQQTAVYYDPTANYEVRWRDVEYLQDGQSSWLARIYEPQGPGPFPAIVEVHGGAWTLMDRTQNSAIDETLASCGLVVAAVDFHLGGQAPHPAAQADINYAIRWLKAHAAEFRATPEALGGLGFSSGGHQMMLTAMQPRHPAYATIPLAQGPNVDASLAYVILAWPPIDPYARYVHARNVGRQDLIEASLTYFGDEATMQEANPQRILARGEAAELPPALVVQGAADNVVPPTGADEFVSAYARAGGVIELAKYPGEGHRFMGNPGPNTSRVLDAMKAFISRQLAAAAGDY